MSTRSAARVAALAAVLSAALCIDGPALASRSHSKGGGKPLSPAAATRLAQAPGTSGTTATQVVSGSSAFSAASLPGATTWADPTFSTSTAVGLASPSLTGSSGAVAAARHFIICWANAAWHQWGTWPYQQRITDTTYWCASYGSHITYRTSSTTATGTFCGAGPRSSQLIGGGVGAGFTYFTIRASANFSCPTVIPWITLHTHHHEDTRRNDRGGATFTGAG